MNTNVILQYNRGGVMWQCPECDTENRETSERCSVCGYKKTGMEQMVYDAPKPTANRGYSDGGTYEKKPETNAVTTGTAKKPEVRRLVDTGTLSAPKKLTGEHVAGSSGAKSESDNSWIGIVLLVAVVIAVIVIAAVV